MPSRRSPCGSASSGQTTLTVAASLNTLALLYVTQAQYAKAEPLYVRAVATAEQTLGPDHAGMTVLLENYATLLRHTSAPRAPSPCKHGPKP